MIWHTTPRWLHALFPKRLWHQASTDTIYLTFDDGPVSGVTDFVLNELSKRNQRATFFAVGENLKRNPGLAQALLAEGNQLANHTYNHLNGWKTPNELYLANIKECDEILGELGVQNKLFRPPYGMIRAAQVKQISQTHQVVMWDVLSGDYDRSIASSRILHKSIKHSKAGSVVVFHDQQKTKDVLPKFLPQYLDFIEESGLKTGLL